MMLGAWVAVCLLALPVPAAAAPDCGAAARRIAAGLPQELAAYAPRRLAELATGAGVRVAVLDSGVDGSHPQLRGRVVAGRDVLRGDTDGRVDCVGHGTGVAGVIAAGPDARTGVIGLAPGATIVPVRVSERDALAGAGAFAEAIGWAARHADVVNISLVMTVDDARVRAAVAQAVAAGAVVVAAVGNDVRRERTPYPAAYPGVIGVGAAGPDGMRAAFSQRGPYVDVVAFGDRVTVAAPGGGHQVVQGTSFAVPFVAATVALLRERFPRDDAARITGRLLASADPAPAGARSEEYGYGLLNPYRALTEAYAAGPLPAPEITASGPDPAALEYARRRRQAQDRAVRFAAVALGIAVLCAVAASAVAGARRRPG